MKDFLTGDRTERRMKTARWGWVVVTVCLCVAVAGQALHGQDPSAHDHEDTALEQQMSDMAGSMRRLRRLPQKTQ